MAAHRKFFRLSHAQEQRKTKRKKDAGQMGRARARAWARAEAEVMKARPAWAIMQMDASGVGGQPCRNWGQGGCELEGLLGT